MHSRIFVLNKVGTPEEEINKYYDDDFYSEGTFSYGEGDIYDYVDIIENAKEDIEWLSECHNTLVKDNKVVLSKDTVKDYFNEQYDEFEKCLDKLKDELSFNSYAGINGTENKCSVSNLMYKLNSFYENKHEFQIVVDDELMSLDHFMRNHEYYMNKDKMNNFITTEYEITQVFDYHW